MEPRPDRLIWYPGHELLLPAIVRAENGRLYDSEGRAYVDLESGVWCTPIGHGYPRVLRILAEQSRRITHTGYCYSSPVASPRSWRWSAGPSRSASSTARTR